MLAFYAVLNLARLFISIPHFYAEITIIKLI